MLSEGDAAPDFRVTTLRGESVRLAALRGTPVWVGFFRFASCPLCNYRVHQMAENWSRFEGRRFRMLAVFQSPPDRLEEYVASEEPPFDLVADPDMELYRLYGLESSWAAAMSGNVLSTLNRARQLGKPLIGPTDGPPARVPGDYLVDRDGTIVTAYRGEDIADHLPLDRALAFLDAQGA
jgi:peroxiredoxin